MVPSDHKVAPGECIASIAEHYGFAIHTLWDHPRNASLKAARSGPWVLKAGDIVHIPRVRSKMVALPTGRRHTFRRRNVPEVFRVQFLNSLEPRGALTCTIQVDEHPAFQLDTDKDGMLEVPISPRARRVRIEIPEHQERHEFRLGQLDPIDEPYGLAQRLTARGYLAPGTGTPNEDDLREALWYFQREHGLSESGDLDAQTRAALERNDPA